MYVQYMTHLYYILWQCTCFCIACTAGINVIPRDNRRQEFVCNEDLEEKDFIQERDEVDYTMIERKVIVMRTMKHPFLTVSHTVCVCVCVSVCKCACVCAYA